MKRFLWLGGVACLALGVSAKAADRAILPDFGSFGFDTTGMDRSAKPGDDFFAFANGTYVRNLKIPPDKTSFGTFNILADLSEQRVHAILEAAGAQAGPAPADSLAKAGAFYKSFMDEATVEKSGAAPLHAALDRVRALRTVSDFAALMGSSVKNLQGSLVEMAIAPDSKDPTKYAITLAQGGLGLPDRDYYRLASFTAKKAKYAGFIERMLNLAGWPEPAGSAKAVMAFEDNIAQVSWSRAQSRDADKTYNPMAIADLKKAAPDFDWDRFFAAADLGKPASVVLGEKTAIESTLALTAKTPIETLKAWAALHLVVNAAPFLSKTFADPEFDFFNRELQGQPEQKPRWKRAVHTVDGGMGEAIGQAYVARFYPADARAKMEALTQDLRAAFHDRLEHNDWMSPATRQKALEKLASFDFQIGYPKKWRDYSGLVVKSDDLVGNVERSSAFEWAFWVGHLGTKVDRDQWSMAPQEVNAYNAPEFNEVVFPAAILQPPFFNSAADPAINYGAIGGVIGHEMTHSFDDQGRKFDAQGRLHDWWTKEDAKRFDAKAKAYGAQFAAMQILPGAHIDPDLTMGENIADLGGLTLALDAYHASLHGKAAPVIGGLTGDQRVFMGWAQVWRAKLRDDVVRQRLVVDPHSPPVARVNGPMHNMDAFYSAWNVKPNEQLYLPPANRIKIW